MERDDTNNIIYLHTHTQTHIVKDLSSNTSYLEYLKLFAIVGKSAGLTWFITSGKEVHFINSLRGFLDSPKSLGVLRAFPKCCHGDFHYDACDTAAPVSSGIHALIFLLQVIPNILQHTRFMIGVLTFSP